MFFILSKKHPLNCLPRIFVDRFFVCTFDYQYCGWNGIFWDKLLTLWLVGDYFGSPLWPICGCIVVLSFMFIFGKKGDSAMDFISLNFHFSRTHDTFYFIWTYRCIAFQLEFIEGKALKVGCALEILFSIYFQIRIKINFCHPKINYRGGIEGWKYFSKFCLIKNLLIRCSVHLKKIAKLLFY